MSLPALTLFHSSQTRSTGVLILLEELQLPVDIVRVSFKDQPRDPRWLEANPLGKVPALLADGAAVTEQVAIYQFLAELKPEAGLCPAIGDALRGPFLRWLAIYGSSFEPAMVDKALKREAGNRGMSPYGDAEAVVALVQQQLAQGPWLLGERFTAADVLWASSLGWMTKFGLMPVTQEVSAYLARFEARPAVQKVRAAEANA